MTDGPLIVVGLTGEKRHGKDTASKCLNLSRDCEILHVARPMKLLLRSNDDWIKELAEEGLTERWGQQRFGTESRIAARNPRMWASATAALIHFLAFEHPSKRRRFVIADMSYTLEAAVLTARVHEWGGIFASARIINPRRQSDGDAHSSEAGRASMHVDEAILNDSSKDALNVRVCSFFDRAEAGKFRPRGMPVSLDRYYECQPKSPVAAVADGDEDSIF